MAKRHALSNNFGFVHHIVPFIVVVGLVGIIGIVTLRLSSAATLSKSYSLSKNYYNQLVPELSDDMDSDQAVRSKWSITTTDPSSVIKARQGIYNPGGVTTYGVNDGVLSLHSQRHCVANKNTPMNQANISTAKCAKNQTTKYSVGRLESKNLVSGTFMIEIRAKMPSSPVYGTRSSLWMVNVPPDGSAAYCTASNPKTNLSEFDILEWWTDAAGGKHRGVNNPTMNTHILCDYNTKTGESYRHTSPTYLAGGNDWFKRWHIFSLRYNGKSVQYFVDGKLTRELSSTDSKSKKQTSEWKFNDVPSEKQWKQATENMSWTILLNGDVFTRTKNNKKFPTQTTLIDYVHVYRHAN